ncbi:hypothetical protein AB1L30_05480 [Bremerella sp. JC817]|uniref:hypothetical protein n=1 Tax=Bremerella sp. JC817 TaxID=3231756 RepID=UPI003457C18B
MFHPDLYSFICESTPNQWTTTEKSYDLSVGAGPAYRFTHVAVSLLNPDIRLCWGAPADSFAGGPSPVAYNLNWSDGRGIHVLAIHRNDLFHKDEAVLLLDDGVALLRPERDGVRLWYSQRRAALARLLFDLHSTSTFTFDSIAFRANIQVGQPSPARFRRRGDQQRWPGQPLAARFGWKSNR